MKLMAFADGKDVGTMRMEFLEGMMKPVAALMVVVLAASISIHQKLGMEKDMICSVERAFVQLSIVGFVLRFVFSRKNIFWILLAYLFMVILAGYTAGQRAKHVPHGKYIAGASVLLGTSVAMIVLALLRIFPFIPRYMIPVSGMMVTKAMTATGLTLKCLRDDLRVQQNLVETALALGATARQATTRQVIRVLAVSLARLLDNAKVVGLITLPGMTSGLIMGGASPFEAVQVQMVVLFISLGASTLSSIASIYICQTFFFTKTHQLQSNYLGLID